MENRIIEKIPEQGITLSDLMDTTRLSRSIVIRLARKLEKDNLVRIEKRDTRTDVQNFLGNGMGFTTITKKKIWIIPV